MKKVLFILVMTVVLFPIGGMAQSIDDNNVKFSIKTAYIGFNNNWFASEILVNITTPKIGHMTYLEEYFTVDSDSYPKPVTSKTYYDSKIAENNISFQILRPISRSGKFYNMIRGVIMIDGKRMYERWLRTTSGAHLTFTIGDGNEDIIKKKNNNIAKFETRYGRIITGLPVIYEFTTPELSIYEIGIVSAENNGDIPLRIELLKDISIFPGVRPFPWNVYKYIDISSDMKKTNNVSIRYKVEKSWIDNINISIYDIRLFKWNGEDKKWYILKTKLIDKDDNYIYYESESTNLGIFTIAELNKTVIANMMKVNKSENISHTIDILENKTANISENKTANISENEMIKKEIPDIRFYVMTIILLIIYVVNKKNI